jgi:transcriptional regulator with XRE-family HTH domain
MQTRPIAPSTKARQLRHLLVVALGQEEIGARIKQARDGLGLTQQEFAERIGLKNGANVSRLERGVDEVTPKRLRRIAEETDRPMSFFVAEPEQTPNGQASLADLRSELAALHEDVRELLRRAQDDAA